MYLKTCVWFLYIYIYIYEVSHLWRLVIFWSVRAQYIEFGNGVAHHLDWHLALRGHFGSSKSKWLDFNPTLPHLAPWRIGWKKHEWVCNVISMCTHALASTSRRRAHMVSTATLLAGFTTMEVCWCRRCLHFVLILLFKSKAPKPDESQAKSVKWNQMPRVNSTGEVGSQVQPEIWGFARTLLLS